METLLATPALLELFCLVTVRTSSLLLAVPFLGMRLIPPLAKIGLSLVLAALLTPLLPAPTRSLALVDFLLVLAQEVLIGLLLALAVSLIYGAVQFAGGLLGLQFGFSLANVIDPTLSGQETVIGQFYSLLASLIFFTINGHHLVLTGLARSFELAPPHGVDLFGPPSGTLVSLLLTLSAALFSAALRIALPVMGALLLADVALAVIARTAPQMNVYFVGLPIKIMIGLLAILLALPLTVLTLERLLAGLTRDMLRLVGGG
jgi:flagellar biosynthetic protein FliR